MCQMCSPGILYVLLTDIKRCLYFDGQPNWRLQFSWTDALQPYTLPDFDFKFPHLFVNGIRIVEFNYLIILGNKVVFVLV